MSLNELVKNLDSYTKSELLGQETTRILRLTFSVNDFDALEDDVLNEALIIHRGYELVQSKILRDKLLESLKREDLTRFGTPTYDTLKSKYTDLALFVRDFEIESIYALKSPQDDRLGVERVLPVHNELAAIIAFPHFYQRILKDRIVGILIQNTNQKILASLPTGAGKTILALEIIVDIFRIFRVLKKSEINILWLVSSKELAEQAFQSFKRIWKQKGDNTVNCRRYFGEFDTLTFDDEPTITFATFSLLTSRIQSPDVKRLFSETPYLIIDEAHQADAFTYEGALKKYRDNCSNYNILGLTATPFRGEDNEFLHFKQNFDHFLQLTDKYNRPLESPIAYLIEQEFLALIEYRVLNSSEGKVSEGEHVRTLNQSVLHECKELISKGENSIIFAKSKSHAIALSIFLKKEQISNGLIVGETPDVLRKRYLEDFADKNSAMNILVNHQILSTGIDVPGMNSIMILSEIESPSLALQILGRAMRGPKNGGNKKNTVYLTKENYNRLCDFKLLEKIVLQ